MKPKKIAIFASGTGSNAQNLMAYFSQVPDVTVALVLSNKIDAPVLEKARQHGVLTQVFDRDTFYKSDILVRELEELEIDLIVLAGFLWLVPQNLLEPFKNRIINLHPSLLPDFGGKGMYGMNVHRAVWESGATETGMTIHYVNENYDEGQIIFQAKCPIRAEDTPETIAERVATLEHQHLPRIVHQLLEDTAATENLA
ncbi:phosphoribosylglycinamide formyltransferase [Eisenibacter elegans]|jgi:phosphoribosylglycinamide formyltransferase-1|uniref:phosphoribosylglycinamide formyltransferase n=1 Tax=Eisenibacter elegans TaxID=997 RepID=UPI000415A900|nr:phosphoribosylglycinamide formyltransferase [Eisenibacter elegans]